MNLLEHDGKELLAKHGINVPPGNLISNIKECTAHLCVPGPWVVKGQISAGGRGKAGLIKKAASFQDVTNHVGAMLGASVKGHHVGAVRVEQDIGPADEVYFALMLAPDEGKVRVIVSERGGMDIEELGKSPGTIRSELAPLDKLSITACLRNLVQPYPQNISVALADIGERLADAFLEFELLLVEINPLFVKNNGTWIAGDAKIITDDSAIERQEELLKLVRLRPSIYIDAALKLNHGFEYVVVDPLGEIGLITSGAGLCMMLIDELNACGLKPYNFLDIHAGSFHGKTTRLVQTLNWILDGKNVKFIMVNIMAGGIDLGEFSRVLLAAFDEIQLELPFVIRFAGRNLADAQHLLEEKGIPMHTELDDAVADVRRQMEAIHGRKN